MKKRLKGLLALVMALSMLVGTTLSGEALAAEYKFYGSSLSDSNSGENATELLAGDELVSSFTGGFAVYNDATGKALDTAGSVKGEAAFYEDSTGNFAQNSDVPYYAQGYYTSDDVDRTFVVPALDGYHKFTVKDIVDSVSKFGVQYGTYEGVSYNILDIAPVDVITLIPVPNTYTVVYDKNNAQATGEMQSEMFTFKESANVQKNAFVLEGYTFKEWNTEADGSGTVIADEGDGSVIATKTNNETVTLYAQWEKKNTGETISATIKEFTDDDIPQSLKDIELDTADKIEELLKVEISKYVGTAKFPVILENTVLYDVVLKYSIDGGNTWIVADKDHFPKDGKLHVSIPAPKGSDPTKDNYIVLHMFTTSDFGKTPGGIEQCDVTIRKGDDGIYYLDFYVTGLSPVMIGWGSEKPAGETGETTDKTDETTTEQIDKTDETTTKPTEETNADTETGSPDTSDTSDYLLLLSVLIISGSVAALMVWKKVYQK